MQGADHNLLPGEQIVFFTKKHKIIFLGPMFLTICSLFISHKMYNDPVLFHLLWAPWLVTLIFWGHAGISYWTSVFMVTNKQIMMKEGLFYQHTKKVRQGAIAEITIEQSLLGKFLDYGTVSVNAFGSQDAFSLIDRPFLFQKHANEQIDKQQHEGDYVGS